ncbi:hypothetical protein [Pedobacter chitinilyticus]|uniref:hypothetical protein n=1 Tax=Pedobacter chitinilyticus TaxID=2233776 RepID=UPI001969755D|nr:hypothetical protein [Pedobacter chitinilyticus]
MGIIIKAVEIPPFLFGMLLSLWLSKARHNGLFGMSSFRLEQSGMEKSLNL